MRSLALITVAALGLTASVAAQQSAPVLISGSRVRIAAPGRFPKPIVGRVVYLGDTALVVLEDGAAAVRTVPTDAIGGLDVSLGTKRRTKLGVAIGAPIGAAVAVALGPIVPSSGGPWVGCCGRTGEIIMDVAIGGMAGAFVGGTIGWYTHAERWERVSLDAAPGRVSISIRF